MVSLFNERSKAGSCTDFRSRKVIHAIIKMLRLYATDELLNSISDSNDVLYVG